MSSTVVLAVTLVVVWGGVVAFMRRRVSVIPVVPFVPALLLGLGLLLNLWIDWSGTIAVATLHIVVPAALGVIWHRQRRRTAPEERRRP